MNPRTLATAAMLSAMLSAILASSCVDASTPGPTDTDGAENAATPSPQVPACVATASFDVKEVSRESVCDYDTSVESGALGTLTFPCEGGPARLVLGQDVFEGQVVTTSEVLSLAREHVFEYIDGCTWISTQTITGRLSKGAFRLTYTERPAGGETGCARACEANGTIIVDLQAITP